jgi:hypothetical protein
VVAVVSPREREALLALLRQVRDDLLSFQSSVALARVESAIAWLEAGRPLGGRLAAKVGVVPRGW